MATRLNVVIVQAPGNAERLLEDALAELIGRSGIDVMFVGPLDRISEQSTELLALASLADDVAIVAGISPEQVMQDLGGLGIEGYRARHNTDPDGQPAGQGRRIYVLDVTQFSNSAEIRDAVEQLLESRRTKTFSLGISLAPAHKAPSKLPNNPAGHQQQVIKANGGPAASADRLDLDDLMDQADQFDL